MGMQGTTHGWQNCGYGAFWATVPAPVVAQPAANAAAHSRMALLMDCLPFRVVGPDGGRARISLQRAAEGSRALHRPRRCGSTRKSSRPCDDPPHGGDVVRIQPRKGPLTGTAHGVLKKRGERSAGT